MPQDQVFWYLNRPTLASLRTSLETDIVIIGGGMAGLTAAQAFVEKNKRVVVLEAYYCGAGATGKSSGFITPNSELSLSEFVKRHGHDGGKNIWNTINSGVEHIRNNITKHAIDCDYAPEDSLFIATSNKAVQQLKEEDENLKKIFNQSGFLDKKELSGLIGSENYYGGVLYKNTFGINAYKYCQAMKEILTKMGVQIFEETPVLDFKQHTVNTLHGIVKAKHIIVCTDRFTPNFGTLTKEIYQVQTFLLASQPLTDEEITQIFPKNRFMVWDTELIYNYFRMTQNRLLLGGGSLFNLYDGRESHASNYMYTKLTRYFEKQFPAISLQFEQFWPGMIGISKDVAPITGFDQSNPSIYYIAAATGLPVAAALGIYCADHIIDSRDDLKDYFSPYRKYSIPNWANSLLGNRLSFALSNFMSVGSQ